MARPSSRQQLEELSAHALAEAAASPSFARVLSDYSEDDLDDMRQACRDLARGVRVAMQVPKRAGERLGELGVELTDVVVNGVAYDQFWVYLRPPDPQMIKLIVEQNIGKPGTRAGRKVDRLLEVRHCVPGFSDLTGPPEAGETEVGAGAPDALLGALATDEEAASAPPASDRDAPVLGVRF